jgi:predicted metal-dependent phosphotriesterase family hydrolase
MGKLLDNGFTEREMRAMVRDNPAQVLGARTAVAAASAH